MTRNFFLLIKRIKKDLFKYLFIENREMKIILKEEKTRMIG